MAEKQKNQEKKQKRGIFFGIQLKLIVGFTLLFSVVFAVAFYWFFTFSEDVALQRVQADLRNTLSGAVQGIDIESFATISEQVVDFGHEAFPGADQQFIPIPQYLNDEELSQIVFDLDEDALANFDVDAYLTHVEWLASVHRVEPNAIVYTFVPGPGENQVTYMATSAMLTIGPGGEAPGTVGVDYGWIGTDGEGLDLGENFQALAVAAPSFDFVGYTDDFGSWISGYLRVEDADGNVLGAVGVDFNLEYVEQVRKDLLDQIIIAFVIAYFSLFFLVWLVARTLTAPIQRLTRAAREIGRGNYETTELDRYAEPPLIRDEIHALGLVISDMRDQVYQREQKLITQVRELKIEIDEAKTKQQVDEITDSEFFDHLKTRVKDLRKRDKEKRETGSNPIVADDES